MMDGGKANREMAAERWLQLWLASDKGILNQLSRLVCHIDADFFDERENYQFSDWGLNDLLRYRRARVSGLLPLIDESFHTFLLSRIEQAVDMPPQIRTLTEIFLDELEAQYG